MLNKVDDAPTTMSCALMLTLAYKGSSFSGFALQPHQRTVQGNLEQALEMVCKRVVKTTCAGRTDKGVHAKGQVVSCEMDMGELEQIGLLRLKRSLNALTDDDVVVKDLIQKPSGFSARFDALAREYHYHIHTGSTEPLFMKDYSWFVPGSLDREAMEQGSRYLVGEHDFKSFCLAASAQGRSTIRQVYEISFHSEVLFGEEILTVKVVGNAFLHSMVRTIVGTLVQVGKGQRNPDWVERVLTARNRAAAGENAPAQGLVFWRVIY